MSFSLMMNSDSLLANVHLISISLKLWIQILDCTIELEGCANWIELMCNTIGCILVLLKLK